MTSPHERVIAKLDLKSAHMNTDASMTICVQVAYVSSYNWDYIIDTPTEHTIRLDAQLLSGITPTELCQFVAKVISQKLSFPWQLVYPYLWHGRLCIIFDFVRLTYSPDYSYPKQARTH